MGYYNMYLKNKSEHKKEHKDKVFKCRISNSDEEIMNKICYIDHITKSELFRDMLYDRYNIRKNQYAKNSD